MAEESLSHNDRKQNMSKNYIIFDKIKGSMTLNIKI